MRNKTFYLCDGQGPKPRVRLYNQSSIWIIWLTRVSSKSKSESKKKVKARALTFTEQCILASIHLFCLYKTFVITEHSHTVDADRSKTVNILNFVSTAFPDILDGIIQEK